MSISILKMIILVCFLVVSCSGCNTRINNYSTITTVIQKNSSGNQTSTSYGVFNNIYSSIHFEENLNTGKVCFGDCSLFNPTERFNENHYYPYIKNSFGTIHACMRISSDDWPVVCQVCACLCERNDDPKLKDDHTDILDSFCLDPISVDLGFVVTGVRFKKRENKIHLELQQGKLRDGKIIEGSVSWKHTNFCENHKKVIGNFKGWTYDGMKVVLEDIILPDNAVVPAESTLILDALGYASAIISLGSHTPGNPTFWPWVVIYYSRVYLNFNLTGAAFTTSVEGKFLDSNGNINNLCTEIDQHSQCSEKTIDLVHVGPKLMPPTAFNETITELSQSYLQEVVTNPPQPINGIGYYQGQPKYGGYLALKIFVKKKIHDGYMEGNVFAHERLVPYM